MLSLARRLSERINAALRTTSPSVVMGSTMIATWLVRYLWRTAFLRALLSRRWQESQRERIGRVLLVSSAIVRRGYRKAFVDTGGLAVSIRPKLKNNTFAPKGFDHVCVSPINAGTVIWDFSRCRDGHFVFF